MPLALTTSTINATTRARNAFVRAMNLDQTLNQKGSEGRRWLFFKRSNTSKKKIISALVDWNQNLSKELVERNQSERELNQENGDLRCLQVQLEEKLKAALKEVNESKGKEAKLEQKLSKFEERKRTLEEEVGTRKTQIIENEMFKQQHENEIRRLEAEIKEKTETLNSVIDTLEKCKHDHSNCEKKCLQLANELVQTEDKLQNAEVQRQDIESECDSVRAILDRTNQDYLNGKTKFQTMANEKLLIEEKLRTVEERRRTAESDCKTLRDLMKIHENRQIQLETDLRTTRQVLNEAYREKHELEKQSEVEIETLKFEVHTLNRSIKRKKMLTDKMRQQKEDLMGYYQDKIATLCQDTPTQDKKLEPPLHCIQVLGLEESTSFSEHHSEDTNNLKNKISDLEFRLYRHQKLVEALCDIIQSHDPNFSIEEDEVLQSFLDPTEDLPTKENESRAQADTDYTFDFSDDLDFCTDEEIVERETTPSLSNDTCATYDSAGSDIVSDESKNTISLDKSISFDTCNSYTSVSTSLSVDSDI